MALKLWQEGTENGYSAAARREEARREGGGDGRSSRMRERKTRPRNFRAVFSRDGKDRGARLQRALAGAPDISLWIAQTAARTKIFTARPILQRLLEDAKTRSALYIDSFFLRSSSLQPLLEML
jgi:hypothetical protein